MLRTPLPNISKLQVNLRPVKIAYILNCGDQEGFARVIRLACTQWGGIFHVLVPVMDDLTIPPIFQAFLRVHEPDQFVSYLGGAGSLGADDKAKLRKQILQILPHRAIDIHQGARFEQTDRNAHALSVIDVEDVMGRANYGAVLSGTSKPSLSVHHLHENELPEWVQLALYGAIYPGQESIYEEQFSLKPSSLSVGTSAFWKSQASADPFSSVLNLTSFGVSPRQVKGGTAGGSHHLDIVLVNSVASACLYWNMRALRESIQFEKELERRTLLLPEGLVADPQSIADLTDFARTFIPFPGKTTNLYLRFHSADGNTHTLLRRSLVNVRGLVLFTEKSIKHSTHWSNENPPAIEDLSERDLAYSCSNVSETIYTDVFPESFQQGVRGDVPASITPQFGRNEILFEPPADFRNRLFGEVSVDLQFDVWNRYPHAPRIAQAISPNSWFSHYGITGRMAISKQPAYLSFNLPDEWDSLRLFFSGKGYEIRNSLDGSYGDALVNLVGGIQGIGIFASKPAYLLMDRIALKSTKKIAQHLVRTLGLHPDRAEHLERALVEIEVIPELRGIPKSYSQLVSDEQLKPFRKTILALLSQLSESQVIKRGFYLRCPQCGAPDWYPLQNLQEQLLCTGCANRFPLPIADDGGSSEVHWQYRLNTLANRAVDQDVLPNIIALHHLTHERPCASLSTGLELVRDGRVVTELDFVFVDSQNVCGGECKAGTELEDKDLEKAFLAADLGFSSFHFCTVREFSGSTLAKIEQVRRRISADASDLEIGVVTGRELLGEHL